MKKPLYVRLTEEDRTTLEQMTRGGQIKARVYKRARILLAADRTQEDWSGQAAIVKATGASTATVSATCRRYSDERLTAALSEKARPGAAPKVTGEVEAKLVMLACSCPPDERVAWTLDAIAR